MNFKRHDLHDPSVYTWHAESGDDPHKVRIDARLLDATEGYEVLLFLNEFAERHAIMDRRGFQHAEALLHEKPSRLEDRDRVMQWMSEHWLPPTPLSQFS